MSSTAVNAVSPNALMQLGVEALTKALGPVGMANFIRQFDNGHGDYTKERHALFDNLTTDEIYDGIMVNRK